MKQFTLDELQKDCSVKQKKGLHFIVSSVFIWAVILVVHLSSLDIMQKNLLTFCATALLFPLAWMLSKWLKIDFQNKENPLTKAGILFSVNQMLYMEMGLEPWDEYTQIFWNSESGIPLVEGTNTIRYTRTGSANLYVQEFWITDYPFRLQPYL